MWKYKTSDDGFHRLIRYKGIFDFDGFYKYMVKWIKERDYDFYENRVWDKPPYKIYELEGRKKINYWVMFLMLPQITLWNAEPVEVVKDGKVKHLTQARMQVLINGGIIFDYDGDFEKGPMLKKIEYFMHRKILYHETFLKYFDYMDYHLYDFMTDMKKYLDMITATNAY